MSAEEKGPRVVEQAKSQASSNSDTITHRLILRKVDVYLIPWLAILYLLSFMDRGTIGNAKLYHLADDLHISDNQYLIALTVFFFPYSLFEPASNVLLRRTSPTIWLSSIMILWGVVTTLHGVVTNYAGLLIVRIFLGLTEAGLYPGIVFYLSCWYKRSELGLRVAVFFSSATLAGAFSGLLATAIANMDGVGGLAGWRWIFILEGILTVVVGVASFWVIQDFPHKAKFLKPAERAYIIERLQNDQQISAGGEGFEWRFIKQSIFDWKTWVAMGIYMGFDGPLYAFSLFLPTIISQLGYHATTANLMSVPVYVVGCIVTCVVGFASDRVKSRGIVNLILFGIGLAGYIILIASRTPGLSYFAVFLAAAAIYSSIPNSVAWVASNVEGAYKRSVTLGIAIGFGNLNGCVGANVYRARDRPWYSMGHGIVLAYIGIGFISSLTYTILLARENAARDRGARDEVIGDQKTGKSRNGHYESLEAAKADKGDEWSGFRYTI